MENNLLIALKNKQFLYLWLAEIFTQIPVNLFNFLLILVIFKLTNSNTAVSIIVLSFTLPAVFLGILAGVYTDKWNKKKVLYISNYLRAFSLILLALFSDNVYVIYIVSFFFGIITQFFIPAESPIIPLIVSEKQLLSANSLFGIGIFGSILIAYLFSGPIFLSLGFQYTLILLAMLLVIGAIFISRIQVPESEEKKLFNLKKYLPLAAIKKEIFEVAALIRSSHDILNSLLLLALSQILILTIAAIAPGYAKEVLNIKVEQFPLVVITPAALGIIAGALYIPHKLHKVEKRNIITTGLFLSALVLIIMPFCSRIASRDIIVTINQFLPSLLHITNIDLIVLLAFLLGVANSFVFIPSNTLLQEKTDDTIRGKMYGVLNAFVGIFSFTPILLVGSFSDLIGVSRVVIGIGFSLLAVAILRIVLQKKHLASLDLQ